MRLGFSYWGFCEDIRHSAVTNTPDGGRYTRPLLVKELIKLGVEVIALQPRREAKPIEGLTFDDGFPKLDALLIEWRWPTYKNDKNHPDFGKRPYEPDLDRQTDLLYKYLYDIPVIIFDTDLKFSTESSKLQLAQQGIIVYEPCLNPSHYAFSLPYWTDGVPIFGDSMPHDKTLLYLGSNYERYWGIEKYYYNVAKELRDRRHIRSINVKVIGNWLDKSPERPEQEELVKKYSEYIKFYPRNTMLEGFQALAKAITTIHIGKKEYMEKGLVAPRYLESLVCGTPALTTREFFFPIYGREWSVGTTEEAADAVEVLSMMGQKARRDIVEEQKEMAMKNGLDVQTAAKRIINAATKLMRGE